jgi:hypothetical protein
VQRGIIGHTGLCPAIDTTLLPVPLHHDKLTMESLTCTDEEWCDHPPASAVCMPLECTALDSQ